jgi:hypothetical protein
MGEQKFRKYTQIKGSDWNGTYLNVSDYLINVGWVRHAVCAVTHQPCRQAFIEQCVVLLRNGWWVTHKTLTHPTFRLTDPAGK